MNAVGVAVSSVALEQVSNCGSGLQLPSIVHVAIVISAGLKPDRHGKFTTSPSTYGYLLLACTEPFRGEGGTLHTTNIYIYIKYNNKIVKICLVRAY